MSSPYNGGYSSPTATTSSSSSSANDNSYYGSSLSYSYAHNGSNYGAYEDGYPVHATSSNSSSSSSSSYSNPLQGEYKDKPIRSSRTSQLLTAWAKHPWMWAVLCVVALLGLTANYRSRYHFLLQELHAKTPTEAVQSLEHWQHQSRTYELELQRQQQLNNVKVKRLEDAVREAKHEQAALVQKHQRVEDTVEEHARLVQRDQAWIRQVVRLQHAITAESRRSVIQK
jgi:hypothetical protein